MERQDAAAADGTTATMRPLASTASPADRDAHWQSEQHHRAVVEALGEGVMVQDERGVVRLMNQSAARILGAEPADWVGNTTRDVDVRGGLVDVHGAPVPPGGRSPRRALETNTPITGTVYGMMRRGRRVWIELDAWPLVSPGAAAPYGVVTVLRDVTERRTAELALEDAHQFRRLVLQHAADGYVVVDATGQVTAANPPPDGASAGATDAAAMAALVHPDDAEVASTVFAAALATPAQPVRGEWRVRDASGEWRWLEQTVTNQLHEPAVQGVIFNYRDITDHARLRRAAEEDRERLADAQRMAHVGSFEHDLDTNEITWSEELYRIWGMPLSYRPRLADYAARIPPEDLAVVRSMVLTLEAGNGHADVAHRIIRADGAIRWVHVRCALRHDGERRRITGTTHDITELKLAEMELARQAHHDALTGLPNRLLVEDRLAHALERRTPAAPVTVMFLDVDRFKLINDGLGHAAGDQVLNELSTRLADALRPGDTLGRLGGDEFVVICEELGEAADAMGLAERVRRAVERPVAIDGREIEATVSIGVARSGPGCTVDSMLRDADAAMYRAKRRGRARVEMFDDALRGSA
jgi:diguanylate cyclase (GGDEF)-like protein/PAS domain S-box-containing protein